MMTHDAVTRAFRVAHEEERWTRRYRGWRTCSVYDGDDDDDAEYDD